MTLTGGSQLSVSKVFFQRFDGATQPWTDDPILQRYKFTNAYRAADRASQFLIKNVIYQGDQAPTEILFRILTFKLFNSISTWCLLERSIGSIEWASFDIRRYASVLAAARHRGDRIYSAAYIMPSAKTSFGSSVKHENHLKLIKLVMTSGALDNLRTAGSLEGMYQHLRAYPSIGPFLAFQFAIDINYSPLTNFEEMSFVVPGPGAYDGMKKCFTDPGDYTDSDIIRWTTEQQESAFDERGLQFRSLWGRPLQLIDCQNLFCEISKYARVAHPEIPGLSGRTRIKQQFSACSSPIDYWFPPKWQLNELISIKQKSDGMAIRTNSQGSFVFHSAIN